jgi:hypothetical protein
MTYKIEYSKQAEKDIENLFDVIINDFKAPITAFPTREGVSSRDTLSVDLDAISC